MREAKMSSTILVVEDEMLVRMHGTDILEEAGFSVIEAANADEALAILTGQDAVHLLFSDVDMPGSMDGLALARQVHQRWPNIRLLLTSGHHRLNEDQLPDNGKFLGKPWTHDVLLSRIRELLRI
jgi:CheY-like chemotaxis protein